MFRQDGIRLIPTDVTIYNGLSGSPVLLNDEVIGVLSGSLEVGRGISWGIPVDYLRSMQEVGRRAAVMGQWPDFVMTADWSNVRATYRLSAGVREILDQYFDGANQLSSSYRDVLVKLHNARAALTLAIQLFTPPSGTPNDADWWPGEIGERFVEGQLAPAVTQVRDAFSNSAEIEAKIRYALGRLLSQKKEQYAGLPRTVTNLRAMDEAEAAETRIMERYKGLDENQIHSALNFTESLKNMRPVGELPSREQEKFRLRPVLLDNWRLLDHMLEDQTGFEAADMRNARLQRYLDIGELFEEVFFHGLDLVSEPLQYRSRLGYTVTMPGGWVQASQEFFQLDEFRQIPRPGQDVDLSFLKTGFFGDDRSSFDNLTTALFTTSDPVAAPYTDEELTTVHTSLLNKGLRTLPDFREFSLQPAMVGSRYGAFARAVYGPQQKPSHYQQWFIILPNHLFTVVCYISPDGDISECEGIVNSVRFD
jgi:hypothetical protein